MSTEFEFDIQESANKLRRGLQNFKSMERVSPPEIKRGEKGQYISIGVKFVDDVDHPDVKFNNELATYLDMFFGDSEDWWFSNDMPGYYGVVNTYGLNPRPQSTAGSHTL